MSYRVAHLASSAPPESKGTALRISNLIDPARCRTDVYAPAHPEAPPGDATGNPRIVRLPIRTGPRVLRSVPWLNEQILARAAAAAMRPHLDADPPDILHAHGPGGLGLAAARLASRRRIPYVLEIHQVYSPPPNRDWWPMNRALVAAVRLTELEQSLRRPPIIALGEGYRAWIESSAPRLRGRVIAIPNGVDAAAFDRRRNAAAAKEARSGWGDPAVVVSYFGYLDDVNGTPALLAAIPEVLRRRDDVSFVLAGHGPYEAEVRRLATKLPRRVRFAGLVPSDRMGALYAATDVFVLPRPSLPASETILPLKVLEAMASGCVVVATRVGAVKGLVEDGVTGVEANPDGSDLAEAIMRAIPLGQGAVPRAAVERVRRDYAWERARGTLHDLYERLLARP